MEAGPGAGSLEELAWASRRAGVVEVCWLTREAGPRATAAVPLVHDGRPALALLWSQAEVARELASSRVVAWVLSDRRLAQPDWHPLLAFGRFRLIEDAEGDVFVESMLDLELRKHPPSRAYADNPLLRRENWWFLPRLVLVLDAVQVLAVGERTDPDAHAVLAVAAHNGSLAVDTVAILESTTSVSCTSLRGRAVPPAGDAVLFTHDFSVPDLERWGRHVTTGRWDGRGFDVVARPETRGIPPPPPLRERVRRHRSLERGCVEALRRA